MIPDFIFINRNSTTLGRNTLIDVFGVSLDDVVNIVDLMDRNPYSFADASDTKFF